MCLRHGGVSPKDAVDVTDYLLELNVKLGGRSVMKDVRARVGCAEAASGLWVERCFAGVCLAQKFYEGALEGMQLAKMDRARRLLGCLLRDDEQRVMDDSGNT